MVGARVQYASRFGRHSRTCPPEQTIREVWINTSARKQFSPLASVTDTTMADLHSAPEASLQYLPNELILEIMAYLLPRRGFLTPPELEEQRRTENTQRIQALRCLASTSRHLNALSTPLLYRSWVQLQSNSHHSHKLLLFLRTTVLERPKTLQHLRYVEVRPGGVANWWDPTLNAIEESLKTLQGPATGLSKFLWAVGIVFRLANNLDELAFDGYIYYKTCDTYHPNLDRLQRLSLCDFNYPVGGVVTIAAPLASDHSPVSLYRWNSRYTDPGHITGVELQDLSLDDCNHVPAEIDLGLRVCLSLKRFTCRWRQYPELDDDDAAPIDLHALRQSLGRFRHCLEHLELDTSESRWQVTLDEHIPTIGDLRDFTVLKHMDVSGLVIWSDDEEAEERLLAANLPASLETLVIKVEWDDYVEENLEALSKNAATQLPNLKSIDCSWSPAPVEVAPLLTNMFDAVGIDLTLSIVSEDGQTAAWRTKVPPEQARI
jgi:hypothetical protein